MPDATLLSTYRHLVYRVDAERGWQLSASERERYAAQLVVDCPFLAGAPPSQATRVIANFHGDHHTVHLLRYGDSLAHSSEWTTLMTLATRILVKRKGSVDQLDAGASTLDDLVQNALLDVIVGLRTFEYRSSLARWMSVTTTNSFNRHLRRLYAERRAHLTRSTSLEALQASGFDPCDTLSWQIDVQVSGTLLIEDISDMLKNQNDGRLVRVFELHILGNRSMRATAEALHLSVGMIHSLAEQVRGIIREYINDYYRLGSGTV